MSVTLFEYKDSQISVNVSASFKDGNLTIEGYDIGKRVEQFHGDVDYEYSLTILRQNIPALRKRLELNSNDENELLDVIATRFNTNACFSQAEKFLVENGIPHNRFSWI